MDRRSFFASSMLGAGMTSLMGYLKADEKSIPGFERAVTKDASSWTPFSDKKLKMGIVGCGVCHFGSEFEFQNHPNVDIVAVSDLIPERCDELAKSCRCDKQYPSLEEMVKDDEIEAIFLATDAPSHAKHSILCLEHGKHVCHAVPTFYGDIDDAYRLFETVKGNPGLKYAMFETSTFHEDLYKMEKLYAAGVFGKLIYSTGEYCHPHVIGTPPIGSYNGWREIKSPLWYPTHGSAYYVGVTHQSITEVATVGVTDLTDSPIVDKYGSSFLSEVAVCRTSEGGVFVLATSASFGEYVEGGFVRGQYGGYDSHNGRIDEFIGDEEGKRRLEKALAEGLVLDKPALPPGVHAGGHGGSHGYLGDDFVRAVLLNRKPRVDIIDSLNMTVPGYFAHLSALKGGELLKVPQFSID